MYLLRLGVIATLLSDSLVSGFITSAAIHVFTSQVKDLLGLKNLPKRKGAFRLILVSMKSMYSWPKDYTCKGKTGSRFEIVKRNLWWIIEGHRTHRNWNELGDLWVIDWTARNIDGNMYFLSDRNTGNQAIKWREIYTSFLCIVLCINWNNYLIVHVWSIVYSRW